LRKVHTSESSVEIAHLRNVLEASGIACLVRNDRLGGIVGEIPFLECWPELWVVETGLYLKAKSLVDEVLRAGPDAAPWRCAGCGESIEGQFAVCWNCGAAHAAGLDVAD
jgi:hypothetical protein